VRWDGPQGECFNLEANNHSIDSPPDDYYRTGQYALRARDEQSGCLLRSKTPREELAAFLSERGHRWRDFGRWRPAAEAFAWASALAPANGFLKVSLGVTLNRWCDELRALEPPGFPAMHFSWPPRRYPAALPWGYERDILVLEAWENLLRDPEHERRWWEPLRRHGPFAATPKAALVRFDGEGQVIKFTGAGPVVWPPGAMPARGATSYGGCRYATAAGPPPDEP
jgi:hypothetical protein